MRPFETVALLAIHRLQGTVIRWDGHKDSSSHSLLSKSINQSFFPKSQRNSAHSLTSYGLLIDAVTQNDMPSVYCMDDECVTKSLNCNITWVWHTTSSSLGFFYSELMRGQNPSINLICSANVFIILDIHLTTWYITKNQFDYSWLCHAYVFRQTNKCFQCADKLIPLSYTLYLHNYYNILSLESIQTYSMSVRFIQINDKARMRTETA